MEFGFVEVSYNVDINYHIKEAKSNLIILHEKNMRRRSTAEAPDKSTGTKECADSCRYIRSKTYTRKAAFLKATPA